MAGTAGRAKSQRTILTWGVLPLLLSISLLSGCLSHQISETEFRPERTHLATDRVELPATFHDGFVVVEATLNGTGPYRLMLDTGASHLILFPAAQRRAKLARHAFARGHITVVGGARTMTANVARVESLEAGGFRVEGARALLIKGSESEGQWQTVLRVAKIEHIDGVLGMSVLYDPILEIDFPGRKVVLHDRQGADLPAERVASCEYLNHTPRVKFQLGQQEFRMLVDTGFNGNFHFKTLADLPLVYPPQKFDGIATYGLGGREPRGANSQIDGDLRLGPVRWRDAEVGIGNDPAIGIAALRSLRLAFDQPAGQIFFLGNHEIMVTERNLPTDPRYKAGFLGEIQESFIRLVEVDTGGSFDHAGLQVGDLITAFDAMLPLEWLRHHRASEENASLDGVKLSVLRNAAKFETTVLLREPTATDSENL